MLAGVSEGGRTEAGGFSDDEDALDVDDDDDGDAVSCGLHATAEVERY